MFIYCSGKHFIHIIDTQKKKSKITSAVFFNNVAEFAEILIGHELQKLHYYFCSDNLKFYHLLRVISGSHVLVKTMSNREHIDTSTTFTGKQT